MKYIAIEFTGQNEVNGYRYICMNGGKEWAKNEYVDDSDTVRIARNLSASLEREAGYEIEPDSGKVFVDKAFSITNMEMMQYLIAVNRRIQLKLYNPLLLYCCGERIPKLRELTKFNGVEGIVDIIEKYYNR